MPKPGSPGPVCVDGSLVILAQTTPRILHGWRRLLLVCLWSDPSDFWSVERSENSGMQGLRLVRTALHTGGVTGSIPVAPTIARELRQARSSVAERSYHMGEVRGSIPLRAYHPLGVPFRRRKRGGEDAVDAYRRVRSSSRGRIRGTVFR